MKRWENPERVRVIIEFAVKSSKYPQTVVVQDFQSRRDMGITDDEILQIANVASIAVYLDTMADTFKVEVDQEYKNVLGQ